MLTSLRVRSVAAPLATGMLVLAVAILPGCTQSSDTPPQHGAAAQPAQKAPSDPRCVLPTGETILSGKYTPLSRPLFLHVNKASLERPEVAAFLRFYLNEGQPLVNEVGYIQLSEATRAASVAALDAAAPKPVAGPLSGVIRIDGSSTVFPITQAMAEQFMETHPDVKITVGLSGTGGGFKKFVVGETDINDSSRPITESEIEKAGEKGIEYVELPVAIDGLTVVVHLENDWCDCLTVEQLKALWEPGSQINTWKDLNPAWPDKKITLHGADSDSGTFDYFTEAIVGKAKSSRTDYNASADDNQLVVGVNGDKYSLGYFGYAYYVENSSKLKALGIIPAGTAEAAPAAQEKK